jgi:hypothetical protein
MFNICLAPTIKKSTLLGGGIYNYYLISLDAIYTWWEAIMVEINGCTVGCPSPRENYGQLDSRLSTTIYFELIAKFHSTS